MPALSEAPTDAGPRPGAGETMDFAKWGPVRREKMSPLRRTVSQRMVQSWTTIPKINQFDDADITALLALRKKYAPAYENKQARLTLTAFVVKAVAGALQKYPRANSSLDEAAHEIVYKDYRHIGIAVDTEGGLIVPVLRDADKKSLLEISSALHEPDGKNPGAQNCRSKNYKAAASRFPTRAASAARTLRLSYTRLKWRSWVSDKAAAKPVVIDGKIAVRMVLPLCLAYDHRVLDGADAVRFLREKFIHAASESISRRPR